MYQFINDYPRDKENHFSEEIQGVCHDDKYWFFTQDGSIWKIPVGQDLNQDFKSKSDKSKEVIKVTPGGHLGDMDYYENYLFIADHVAEDDTYISVYRAGDLSYVNRQAMRYYRGKRGANFHSIGWCAINKGFLYTSESQVGIHCDPIYIYKIDLNALEAGKDFLVFWSEIHLYDETGHRIELKDMQGGCFDDQDRLHIANGFYKNSGRSEQGITVVPVPATPYKGGNYLVKRIAKSQQHGGFQYEFDSYGEEPEGLTWWDLDGDTKAPGFEGKLHVILLNNDIGSKDNFWFKHYSLNKGYEFGASISGEVSGPPNGVNVQISLYESGNSKPVDDYTLIGEKTYCFGVTKPGNYTLEAKADGYETKRMELNVNESVTKDISLSKKIPAFTTPPKGGKVPRSALLKVSWKLNFDPVKQVILQYGASGSIEQSKALAPDAEATLLSASANEYCIRAYYSNTGYIESERFTVKNSRPRPLHPGAALRPITKIDPDQKGE